MKVLFIINICGWIGICLWLNQVYKQEVLSLDKKEYTFWRFICFGLFLVDHLPMEKIIKKPNYHILQLYGRHQYSFRIRLYEAEKMTLITLFIIGTITMMLVLMMKGGSVQPVHELVKAPYGKGDIAQDLSYELETGGERTLENLTVVVPEQIGTQEQNQETLTKILKMLPDLILGDNLSLEHVTKPLNLINSYKNGDMTLVWESQNKEVLLNTGQIRFNNVKEAGEEVTLKGAISYNGLTEEVHYEIVIFPKELSLDERRLKVVQAIEAQLSRENLKANGDQKIPLPTNYKEFEAKMKWYNGQKKVPIILFLMSGLTLSFGLNRVKLYELKQKVKKRQEELLIEFPGCINKFALLMNAGMTFNRAWEKITQDYVKLKQSRGERIILYEEMVITLEDISKGMPEIKAYEAFGQRCKIPEILRFTSLIVQNIKKGSHLLIGALQQQSKEALTIRQDLARKKGEKASTKLIFPMGIMFLAIIIIVMTPAIITLKI